MFSQKTVKISLNLAENHVRSIFSKMADTMDCDIKVDLEILKKNPPIYASLGD